ncbi:carbohydrate ABC transporter permease [Paenibacillus sp. HWE-109]|uniref:carbohydrate ABC transporter permease n=1 Tax=Paenibacillus sp. HWE-109 TaxID=1306526 RepID=UPI001EDD5FEB|nr:carbohydrate ABC transporter permease [Paenibacillus sp. HWE-109]UKS28315.1 carbohydrate ABC transporter permease [Paenibacillus sp. HWE-109]
MLIALKKQLRPQYLIAHLILLGGGLILVYPLVFMFMASLFTREEYNTAVIGFFPIAKEPTLANLKLLFFSSIDKTTRYLYLNSIYRTAYATFFAVLTALLGGYVFARLRFKGKGVLFMALLATQMIPTVVALLPTYLEFVRFPFARGNYIFTGGKGLFDTWWVYILLNGGSIYILGVFLIKQSLEKVPNELDEAAKVDGAGTIRLIFQILMPLLKPVLAYIAITVSIATWNDWSAPFFYTNSSKLQTLASGLSKLTAFAGAPGSIVNYPLILSLSLLLTVPSVLLFFLFQNLIVQGLANAGLKG